MSITHKKYPIIQTECEDAAGGLPECVASWAEEKNSGTVLQIHKELLSLYENDIAKHNKKIDAGRILLVFKSLVTQLSKENEKFIYGCVKQGARAREFEVAIEWLVSAGLVLRVSFLVANAFFIYFGKLDIRAI